MDVAVYLAVLSPDGAHRGTRTASNSMRSIELKSSEPS